MKDQVLDKPTEEATNSVSRAPNPQSSDKGSMEKRLNERMEGRLDEIKKGISEALSRMQERVTPLIDERIKLALSGSFAALTNTTKEALNNVVQAILFDSGILEKLVGRIVDEKIPARAGGSSQGLDEPLKREVQGLIQKAISAAIASEEMKMMIDEKFRAISLYLKTDVIPKAIQDASKAKAAGAGHSVPGHGTGGISPAPAKSR